MRARWLFTFGLALLVPAGPSPAAEAKKPALKTYQVPYRLTDADHVLVRVKINGKGPYNFIIDTGAPALFVATSVCKKLGIEKGKDGWGTFDRFEIEGGAVIRKAKGRVETPFQIEGMNALGLAGAQLHGILGYNILARYRIRFDFTKDKLTWTELNFDPGLPRGLRGKGGAPGGLDALGSIMKVLGAFVGKPAAPKYAVRGYLGIEFGQPREGAAGVPVKAVLPKSPAAEAGLRAGDLITHLQGKEVGDLKELHRLAVKLRPGRPARLTVKRQGEERDITVTAGEGL